MQEETNKLYDEYLAEKLDLVFSDSITSNKQSIKVNYKYYNVSHSNNYFYDYDGTLIKTNEPKFEDGLCIVERKNFNKPNLHEFNIGNTNHELLCDEWYNDIYDSKEDICRVEKNGKYSFIDVTNTERAGIRITNEWFDNAADFSEGLACVSKNGKNFYIDTKGNHVLEDKYPNQTVSSFLEGRAVILILNNPITDSTIWNYIDRDGNLISDTGWSHADPFKDGCAMVSNYFITSSSYLINKNGYRVNNQIYNDYRIVSGGYIVTNKNRESLIDFKGNYLIDFYDSVNIYHNLILASNHELNNEPRKRLIGWDGKILTPDWFNDIYYDDDGNFFIVKRRQSSKSQIIGSNGKPIDGKWHDAVGHSSCGYIRIKDGNKSNFIDINGNLISKTWFDDSDHFNYNGLAAVAIKQHGIVKWNIIDTKGKYMFDKWQLRLPTVYSISEHFTRYKGPLKDHIHCHDIDMGDYEVKKSSKGYICKNADERFTIKYKPIRQYGSLVLCFDDKVVYLYNKINHIYEPLGNLRDISFDNNFISNTKDKIIYLVYENKLIDITKYYDEHINGKKEIGIVSGIDIMTKDDFFIGNEDEIRERARIAKIENESIRKKQQEEESLKALEELSKNREKEDKEFESQMNAGITQIMEGITKLEAYEKHFNKPAPRIIVNNFLVEVDKHKEINPIYLKMGLRHIDLSRLQVKEVKLSGLDFRGCNISFGREDPLKVYNRDLSNCNFEGITFLPGTIFDNVNIKGTKFTTDGSDRTMDINKDSFANAIYDENTTLNGVPLVNILDKEEKYTK